jgi:predicted transcriptional regulator
MSNKEAVIEAVRQMPDEVSIEEILEEIAILAAIRRGVAAAEAGQVISHEELKKRAATWSYAQGRVGIPVWTPLNAVDAAAVSLQTLETDAPILVRSEA